MEGPRCMGSGGPWHMGCPWHRGSPVHRGSLVQDLLDMEGPWCMGSGGPWCTEGPQSQRVPGAGCHLHGGSLAHGVSLAQRAPSVGRAWHGQSPGQGVPGVWGVPGTGLAGTGHRGVVVGRGSRGSPRTSTWRPGMLSRQARMEPSSQTSSCLISSVRPSAGPAAAASAPLLPTFLMVAMTGGRGGSAPPRGSPPRE